MSLLQQIVSNDVIRQKILMLPGLILGFTFHEYAHAKVAYSLGDDTPLYEGRLTLNPVRHVDLMGLVFLLLLGFGWAKPVHFNPRKLKKPKRDEGLIGVAGPFTNLVLAFILMIILIIVAIIYRGNYSLSENVYNVIGEMLIYGCSVNCSLLVFNMIPLPPFDGFHVLLAILPKRVSGILAANAYRTIGRYSFLVLIALFYFFPGILSTPVSFVFNSLYSMAQVILRFF
ncbi:MAG: site-2 protease family protein [Oscillospiraceae bacterium]|nr:site-2 protease family protein [Oscillospiraceae bacterium]